MLSSHLDLSDEQFEHMFQTASLDPVLFNHEAHLRLAWIHLKNYGLQNAIINITTQLRNFVLLLGAGEKYHHTLTVAAIKMVDHFMAKSDTDNFPDFINQFPRLKTNFKDLLGQHYSAAAISDPDARLKFLEPDILVFTKD